MSKALEDQDIEVISRPSIGSRNLLAPSRRRVRTFLAGDPIADSKQAILLLERNHLPVYYFPMRDVRMDLMEATDHNTRCPYKGEASYWTIKAGDRTAENAAWAYLDPLPEVKGIAGYVAFYWNLMDSWFEEDDEVFVHPRDPYARVDVLNSSRHVRVVVADTTVAETNRPRLLFETGLPTRYYIPKLDVRMDLLHPSDTKTRCPYKGEASYWNLTVAGRALDDLVWSYPQPIPECPKIENLMCFFNERVEIYVDGEPTATPKTHWS